jgi:hypothetical protein
MIFTDFVPPAEILYFHCLTNLGYKDDNFQVDQYKMIGITLSDEYCVFVIWGSQGSEY